MIDPNGETDYNVSGDGTLIKAHPFVDAVRKFFGVKDDNDKIIAVNRDNKSVILAAGSIGEIKTKDYTDESGKSQNGQFFTVENKSEAVKAYNFLAENTDIEWSQIDRMINKEPKALYQQAVKMTPRILSLYWQVRY
jgi:hypothetical protein